MMAVSTEQIYREYYGSVLNYVNMKINNLQEAENITHDVFEKAHRLIETYSEQRGAVSTWIYKIAYTKVVDYFRTNKQDKYIAVSNFVNAKGDQSFQFVAPERCDEILENKELMTRIMDAMNKLKPAYRMVAEYYFFKEYKYEEIADELDLKVGTVKATISRCRAILRKELENVQKANVLDVV